MDSRFLNLIRKVPNLESLAIQAFHGIDRGYRIIRDFRGLCKLCLLCNNAGFHSCGEKRDHHREYRESCESYE